MLRPRIIVSLLLENEGLVKTKKFKDAKYIGDPINTVKIFNEKKVDELCIFDIGATTQNYEPNYNLI
ncbi:HisA/HisF-related TIM barrel protein, partial [Burkholderia sp. SIMBA_045]